jgi:peptide/nickel transport system substrate-binding protein
LSDGRLRYNESEGIRSLDPVQATKRAHIWVTRLWAETLFETDSSGQVIPWLCAGYRWHDDMCTLRLGIRKNVYFHKDKCFGPDSTRPLSASDVVYSLMRAARHPAAAWIFSGVVEQEDGLAVELDDDSVEIRLRHPQVSFLKMLANAQVAIVPPEVEKHYGSEAWRHPVGTGPYRFRAWFPEQELRFVRNSNYWRTNSALSASERVPNEVQISFVKDKQSEILLFLRGELDFLAGNDRSHAVFFLDKQGRLKEDFVLRGIKLRFNEVLATEYLGFNLEGSCGACRDAKLRRLAAWALDKEHLVDVALEGLGKAADASLVPPALRAHSAQPKPVQSRERGFLRLMTTPPYSLQAALVKDMLERQGFSVSVGLQDGATHKTAVANGECDFFRASWIADFPDAENFYSVFYSGFRAPGGPNYTRFSDPVYDALFERLQKTANRTERLSLYARLDSVLSVAMPAIALYYDKQMVLTGPGVAHIPFDVSGHPVFREARLRRP